MGFSSLDSVNPKILHFVDVLPLPFYIRHLGPIGVPSLPFPSIFQVHFTPLNCSLSFIESSKIRGQFIQVIQPHSINVSMPQQPSHPPVDPPRVHPSCLSSLSGIPLSWCFSSSSFHFTSFSGFSQIFLVGHFRT